MDPDHSTLMVSMGELLLAHSHQSSLVFGRHGAFDESLDSTNAGSFNVGRLRNGD